jgi:hypothetical protein
MTRMRVLALAATLAIGMAMAAACVETRHEGPTSPSEVAKVLATGSWTSAATASSVFNVGSCGNAEWKITSMTDTAASGTFKVTCGGGLTLEGSAEGKLNGMTADLKANGTVSGAGTNCPFSLTGTAVPEGLDKVRINYSGTTCLGPVSGSEVLTKR